MELAAPSPDPLWRLAGIDLERLFAISRPVENVSPLAWHG